MAWHHAACWMEAASACAACGHRATPLVASVPTTLSAPRVGLRRFVEVLVAAAAGTIIFFVLGALVGGLFGALGGVAELGAVVGVVLATPLGTALGAFVGFRIERERAERLARADRRGDRR
jgi:hypothetical protein